MQDATRERYNAYHRVYQKRRYSERMAKAREMLGDECVRCGNTANLHIDHIDPATKTRSLSSLHNCSWERFAAELAKCQLLCAACHGFKTGIIDARLHLSGRAWHDLCSSCLGG